MEKLKAKGIDQVVFIAMNDAWVMSAWGKANGVKDDFIVSTSICEQRSLKYAALEYIWSVMLIVCQIFASDSDVKFSKSIGWIMGDRTARYAIVIDHGKVTYTEKEDGGGIDKSGAEAVLAKL